MVLLTFQEAAARIDTPTSVIENWVNEGLLTEHRRQPTEHSAGYDRCVDEEQLDQVADTIGWMMLSGENWDGPEKE